MNEIPCTVEILTHNSSGTLRRALESVKGFAQILIVDGSSTDDTRAIAAAYGAHVIDQDPRHLDGERRIADFAAIRNQGLEAATQPWFFFLDSDEYISKELASEIRSVTEREAAGAYWIDRKYVVGTEVVECASSYPNRSMRFFARASADRFIKSVHERIKLKGGVSAETLAAPLYVPMEDDWQATLRKNDYYMTLESKRANPTSFLDLILTTSRTIAISGLYLVRLVWIQLFCRGTKMPLSDEFSRHVYNAQLIAVHWRAYFSNSR